MSLAVVTFFYPNAHTYLAGFLNCIRHQTKQDFTLLVFNDGVKNISDAFNEYSHTILFVDVSGTPTQIRFQAFEYLKSTNFEKIVFQDIDDEMTSNRVAVLAELLDDNMIVSNDLSLVNNDGILYAASVWADKINDLSKFDVTYILKKNIVGIGNSGIRKDVLKVKIAYSSLPKVADWFMFYQLMCLGNFKVLFTSRCQTLYRQHQDNMAGVKEFNKQRLEYVIDVKLSHYYGLMEVGFSVDEEIRQLIVAQMLLNFNHGLQKP
ncbi:MAG: hypothetical protein HY062_10330 [Bacteroidetes bacterium]|nr:hypothetical protein [Bacteroidota bacterium]